MLLFGDLYQLPPVQTGPNFLINETGTSESFITLHLWYLFKFIELGEIMHKKDDKLFTELWNNIGTGMDDKSTEDVLSHNLLKSLVSICFTHCTYL